MPAGGTGIGRFAAPTLTPRRRSTTDTGGRIIGRRHGLAGPRSCRAVPSELEEPVESRTRRLAVSSLAALTAATPVAGCGGGGTAVGSGADGNTLTLWTHDAGSATE